MNSGNTPVTHQPATKIAASAHVGPVKNIAASGSITAIRGAAIIKPRRPMRSDHAGIAVDATVAEIPSEPISHPMVDGS